MSIKILTKNSIENTNIDGARENHFSAGMRSGIVKGAFNEGSLFLSANNVIALDSCELRISGHRVILDNVEYFTLSNNPSINTQKSLFAEIVVNENSTPLFRLFVENSNYNLKKDNLFKNNDGSGTYQIEIGTFMHKTDGTITDVFRTIDVITGGAESGESIVGDIVFNGIVTSLSSDSEPQVNIDFNEETGQYDFNIGIPKGEKGDPNTLTVGSVSSGANASATITGTAPNQVLNLVLPRGYDGVDGTNGRNALYIKTGLDTRCTVGSALTVNASDFSRTPVVDDIFATLCAQEYYTIFRVYNVNSSSIACTSIAEYSIKGIQGVQGEKGNTGASNVLTIGSVTSGTTASATITGTSPSQTLNLVLPKGDTGEKGDKGDVGATFTYDANTKTLTITT